VVFACNQVCQEELSNKWSAMKNADDLAERCEQLRKELTATAMRKTGTLMTFWSKQSSSTPVVKDTAAVAVTSTASSSAEESSPLKANSNEASDVTQPSTSKVVARVATAQEKLQSQLGLLNSELTGLYERQKKGLLTADQLKIFKESKDRKIDLERKLKRKKGDQKRSQKARDSKKQKLASLLSEKPELRTALNVRSCTGRPRIEQDQPMLLRAIVDIAMYGSASHEKRQSDVYRSIKTLDQLTEKLNEDGFQISRSALYLRLLPKRSCSVEGKRHVSTVPVKLMKAQNDAHAHHVDGLFCTATIRHLEELSSMLGPTEVCFISQDDKCRVPIGLTAANKQSPLLMHVEYPISLPDHDWVVAAAHKLIPSVYAGIAITTDGLGNREAVGYSGPTYIAIRSGKHSSSTALSHALDFEKLMTVEYFDNVMRYGIDRLIKPVLSSLRMVVRMKTHATRRSLRLAFTTLLSTILMLCS